MGTHGWLHYAGHSRADLGDPGASGLELADGRLTFQEIADLQGCPLSTVKTRLYQGLLVLRRQLERYGEVVPEMVKRK